MTNFRSDKIMTTTAARTKENGCDFPLFKTPRKLLKSGNSFFLKFLFSA